jgi:uncharacterized membrane protein
MHNQIEIEPERPSILRRVLALCVLLVAAVFAIHLIVGLVMAVFWFALAVTVLVAVGWAVKTLVW